MQHLAGGKGLNLFGGVQPVAKQGMPKMGQVHAYLVRAPCMYAHRQQRKPPVRRCPQGFPFGMRGTPSPRFRHHGHLDFCCGVAAYGFEALTLRRGHAADQRKVFLVHLASGKSFAEQKAVLLRQGHKQDAACVLVQPVHNAGALAFYPAKLRKPSQQPLHQRLLRA